MLKFLRRLVTTLTVVMIVGFIVLIGFLVTRFPGQEVLEIPHAPTLPEGAQALSFTQALDWVAVVTDQSQILIFDRDSGVLRQTVDVFTSP